MVVATASAGRRLRRPSQAVPGVSISREFRGHSRAFPLPGRIDQRQRTAASDLTSKVRRYTRPYARFLPLPPTSPTLRMYGIIVALCAGCTHLLLLVSFLVLARWSSSSTSVRRRFRAPCSLERRVATGSKPSAIVHSRGDSRNGGKRRQQYLLVVVVVVSPSVT